MKRLVVIAALVSVAAVVPSASARPARSQAGVGTAIASEIAKEGVKAGIAHFAPDLVKYTDPTAHGIAEIQAKLDELDRKMTQLIDHQQALEEHLNCVIQKSDVLAPVTQARSDLETMLSASRAADPAEVFGRLYNRYEAMKGAQAHIHASLLGSDGLIQACARHIETGMKPYLTSTLATHVREFYGTYHAAEVALLVVRTNLIALHPTAFPADEAEAIAKQLQSAATVEERWIKPAFPNTMSYDKDHKWLWWTSLIPHADAALRGQLQSQGWRVTGRSTTPTCSAILSLLQRGGHTGPAGIQWLGQENVLPIATGYFISCYDDHDHLHDFDLATGTHHYAGNVSRNPPSFAARPNDGLVDIARFSYLNG
jgi:hypothetical protein